MAVEMTVRVRDLMSVPAAVVEPEVTLRAVAAVLAEEMVGALVVLDADGSTGIISERDVVKALAEGANPDEVWAGDVMSDDPVSVGMDETLEDVVEAMATNWVRHLPVVDGGEVRGMVSARDVFLALTERAYWSR